jgi:hypothetical protein
MGRGNRLADKNEAHIRTEAIHKEQPAIRLRHMKERCDGLTVQKKERAHTQHGVPTDHLADMNGSSVRHHQPRPRYAKAGSEPVNPYARRGVWKEYPTVSSAFELVHSDVWGPINIVANKFHYFVTFVDDFSHMTLLFLMKNHSDLFYIFQIFCNMIKTQFAQKIYILHSVNAKDYTSRSFPLICLIKALFIKPHVLTLHNKMVWLNTKIVIYWMSHVVS